MNKDRTKRIRQADRQAGRESEGETVCVCVCGEDLPGPSDGLIRSRSTQAINQGVMSGRIAFSSFLFLPRSFVYATLAIIDAGPVVAYARSSGPTTAQEQQAAR